MPPEEERELYILAHEYGETLVSRVWLAGTKSVPELLKNLKDLLAK